jgi:adenine-specific DNA-methyltransferase
MLPANPLDWTSVRYFGSKRSTVDALYELIAKRISPGATFCDPFGGIGAVGSYFKSKGYRVCVGDHLTFAHTYQVASIVASQTPSFRNVRKALGLITAQQVVEHLQHARGKRGWLSREYSERRRFFTLANAVKIEACRQTIRKWHKSGLLNPTEHAILRASLIDSADKVANTAGTYYAYLKQWHRKALRPFHFALIPPTRGQAGCTAVQTEASALAGTRAWDVLYLDPPYNSRRYDAYYHLPETLALESEPRVSGKAGIPVRPPTVSDFNRPSHASNALKNLLAGARFRLLVLHYSNQGIIALQEIEEMLHPLGHVQRVTLVGMGYTTTGTARSVEHVVYLVLRG